MIEITMPRLSDTMEEGTIAIWHKQPGDTVEVGDILVEIETDKATMEYEAYEAGIMSKLLVAEGESASIGTPIALVDDGNDEPPREPIDAEETNQRADATPEELSTGGAEASRERRLASPLARKLARDHGLDLSKVHGSGPAGRIVRADLDGLLANIDVPQTAGVGRPDAAPAAQPVTAASMDSQSAPEYGSALDQKRASESVAMTQTRRVIARRLAESARSVPHYFVTAAADAEELMELRANLNAQLAADGGPRVSINDLLVRACALALRAHPLVNASYLEDSSKTMQVHHRVNIGVAVASATGLVVPVITDADTKTVTQLGLEAKRLVALANEGKLSLDQMSGGTFTISNLGMFGVEQFTAIINPPQAAILAVGGTKREPTVIGDAILPRHRLRYTLSADHRIVDGALAAQFLQTLTHLIENPLTIVA